MNVTHRAVSAMARGWPIFVQITILAAIFERAKEWVNQKNQYFQYITNAKNRGIRWY
jgi:hypothetical protein